jgi:hypothetical protein
METVDTENKRLSENIIRGVDNVVENVKALQDAYMVNAAAINKLESFRSLIQAKWPDLDANMPGDIRAPVIARGSCPTFPCTLGHHR